MLLLNEWGQGAAWLQQLALLAYLTRKLLVFRLSPKPRQVRDRPSLPSPRQQAVARAVKFGFPGDDGVIPYIDDTASPEEHKVKQQMLVVQPCAQCDFTSALSSLSSIVFTWREHRNFRACCLLEILAWSCLKLECVWFCFFLHMPFACVIFAADCPTFRLKTVTVKLISFYNLTDKNTCRTH